MKLGCQCVRLGEETGEVKGKNKELFAARKPLLFPHGMEMKKRSEIIKHDIKDNRARAK